MHVNLKPIFFDEQQELPVSYVIPVKDIDTLSAENFVSDISVDGRFSKADGIVTLDAVIRFEYTAPCDRCAVDVHRQFEIPLTEKFTEKVSDDSNDDYTVVPDMQIELNGLIVDTLLLSMPTKFLCKEDCKGICPVCGSNLNRTSCDCTVGATDPRWDKLKNLLQ